MTTSEATAYKYVYLPDYVDVIDVPTVPFVLSSDSSSYYSGRPWYQLRAIEAATGRP